MRNVKGVAKTLHFAVRAGFALVCVLGTAIPAAAQEIQDLQTPKLPLLLKAQGSFTVGGEFVSDPAGLPPGGHIAINQMYVQYQKPLISLGIPVVMIHGASLSGKTYETTPDGRMGWDEYFVRQGHAIYLADQVSRARSGFNPSVFNQVRAGSVPPSTQPGLFVFTNELAWSIFRFGPTFGVPYTDQQFPVQAADRLAKQEVPDLNGILPTPNPTWKALSDLATQLKGAVLMGHSEIGLFPVQAALTNSSGTKGLVLVEPAGGCNAFTDAQIAKLATVPILVVFGDHLDTPSGLPGFVWVDIFNDCQTFIGRVDAAHGNAKMLYPPSLGIHGNSHMIMQDKNNIQIADLILKWINQNVNQKLASK